MPADPVTPTIRADVLARRAQIVAVIGHILAEVIRKIVCAVVALPAKNIGAHNDAVTNVERNAFEVVILAVSADRRYRADVLVALNDGEGNSLAFAIAGIRSGRPVA